MPEAEKAHWVEVSLALSNELAEAVSEVLARFCSNGVVVENNTIKDEAADPEATIRVYGYIPADAHVEERKQRIQEALWHLNIIQAVPEPTFRMLFDEDWMAAWKQHYKPIPIGKRLLILPAWYDNVDPSRLAVRIDPSMAFGTGTHPTTQLCLEMLETYCKPGSSIIDIGCGSGILSIAALKLGAVHALGVDVDEICVQATMENARDNGVDEGVEVGVGSVEAVNAWQFSLHDAPLVVANILANIITRLLQNGLVDTVTPGGVLVLSGILDSQSEGVESVAQQQGLELLSKCHKEDWISLAFRRPISEK